MKGNLTRCALNVVAAAGWLDRLMESVALIVKEPKSAEKKKAITHLVGYAGELFRVQYKHSNSLC